MFKRRFTGFFVQQQVLIAVVVRDDKQGWVVEQVKEYAMDASQDLIGSYLQLHRQLPRWSNHYCYSLDHDEVLVKPLSVESGLTQQEWSEHVEQHLSGSYFSADVYHDFVSSMPEKGQELSVFICKPASIEPLCKKLSIKVIGWCVTDWIVLVEELTALSEQVMPQCIIAISQGQLIIIAVNNRNVIAVHPLNELDVTVVGQVLQQALLLDEMAGSMSVAVLGEGCARLMPLLQTLPFVDGFELQAPPGAGFDLDAHHRGIAAALSGMRWYREQYD